MSPHSRYWAWNSVPHRTRGPTVLSLVQLGFNPRPLTVWNTSRWTSEWDCFGHFNCLCLYSSMWTKRCGTEKKKEEKKRTFFLEHNYFSENNRSLGIFSHSCHCFKVENYTCVERTHWLIFFSLNQSRQNLFENILIVLITHLEWSWPTDWLFYSMK